ncbi:WD40 repeat-like protein [Hesseltinella vesiculosa]|uniref:Elongator complex protein 2 n=1 Tax=Hesseltinella vesiculosa TaxID=101127 RepID=A0A1X2GW31_9FUNG|nr:WD40 repeat-like protein [Hesseltinella vesiculosa]
MLSVTSEYVSIGCNSTTQAAAWSSTGLVAFGADKFVAIYNPLDPSNQGIKETLPGHSGRVICVDFIERGYDTNPDQLAIVSGSADNTAKIWKLHNGQWINSATLTGSTGAVETIATLNVERVQGDKDLIVTGSADGTIRIWERTVQDGASDQVECVQTINCGNKYPMSLALAYLPGSSTPVIASGHTDKVINIYVYQQEQKAFEKVYSLQGHDNWVRSLAFTTYTGSFADNEVNQTHTLRKGDLILASGSQDRYIRIWKISPTEAISSTSPSASIDQQPQDVHDLKQALKEIAEDDAQLSTKAHMIQVEQGQGQKKAYTIMFEALLMGHDDWVFSVSWARPVRDGQGYDQPLRLISASSDKSMMIWSPDAASGVWVNDVRMGDIGGNAALGFCGAMFSPDGKHALSYGANGSFHLWKESDLNRWSPQVTISGHFRSVEQVAWDPKSRYLVSVSLDQTTRLYAPWQRTVGDRQISTWHEMGRPQVHGYDLKCLAFTDKWQFVSGADEKVLRLFDAPQACVVSLAELTANDELQQETASRPLGANLPALGLSNKAVFETDIQAMTDADENHTTMQSYAHASATPTALVDTMVQPPFEEHLIQHTLWPEMEKLYGHLYEVMCVDASHDGRVIATACKAASPEHAIVRLFETKTWKELDQKVAAHTLTVTRVRFSHNDQWLLTVSRDRLWSLSRRLEQDGAPQYDLVAKNKAHARIIWDASWSHDDRLFATGSRDKTVKIWQQPAQQDLTSPEWACVATLKCTEAVTALDFAPALKDGRYLLAVGLENGQLQLWAGPSESADAWEMVCSVDPRLCHAGVVRSLAWRITKDKLQLASGGEDHSVRILNVE